MKLQIAKKENAAHQKKLDLLTKELDESDRKTHELAKQKEGLSGEVLRRSLKNEQTMKELRTEVRAEQEKCHNLEKELEKSKRHADSLQHNMKHLESSKVRLEKYTSEVNRKNADLQKEISVLELKISEMEKFEVKLRNQHHEKLTKFKSIAGSKIHTRRLLMQARHEKEQLQNQQILLQKQSQNLRSLNQVCEKRCQKLDGNAKNLQEQLVNIKELHKQEVKNTEELNAKLKRKDDREQALLKSAGDLENVVSNLNGKIKVLLEEKNIQNSKLIAKEDEIKGLRENIYCLQQEASALNKSVNERTEDIKLLKVQIAEMTRRNVVMNKQVECIDETRLEVVDAHDKLLKEKVKSKSLDKEEQIPVNVHRWRILEGIDPDRTHLVTKIQALQKQLNSKVKELRDKEVELQEKVKQNNELLEQLRRRSEQNFQEQLWACKKELSARNEKVKCLTGENYMFESLNEKYRNEITALRDELRKYKIKEMEARHRKKQNKI